MWTRLRELIPNIERFLSHGQAKTSRSPLDFVVYQKLLWRFDSAHSSDEQLALLVSLPSFLLQMQYTHQRRVWCCTFNTLPFATQEDSNTINGAARLFQGYQTVFLLETLNSWSTSLSIESYSLKVKELQDLAFYYREASALPELRDAHKIFIVFMYSQVRDLFF